MDRSPSISNKLTPYNTTSNHEPSLSSVGSARDPHMALKTSSHDSATTLLRWWPCKSKHTKTTRLQQHSAQSITATPLTWTTAAQTAFNNIKHQPLSPPVLVVPPSNRSRTADRDSRAMPARTQPDRRAALVVRCTGAMTRQMAAGGRTLCARSRLLMQDAPVEVEMLGLIEMIRAAEWLLRKANDIVVITDHQALPFIGAMAHREHGRLARWADIDRARPASVVSERQ